MATQVQWRGGTTAEHATFTGAAREVTVDTQKQTLVVHDGSTAGGEALLREDQANLPGSVTNGIYTPGTNQVAVATNGTGRLFVDANGNVGVGLSGPSYPLEVAAPTDSTINITGGTSNVCRLFFSDTALARGFLNYAHADDSLHIGTAGTERLRIDSTGNVGIGTSSPSSQLHCTGDIKFGDAITLSRNPATGLVTIADATAEPYTQGFAFRTNETDEAYRFQNGDGTSTYFTIRGSGNVGIGTSSVSDKLEIANGTTDAANALGIRSGRYLNASQEGAQLKYYSDNTSSWLGTREVARISACGLNSDHRIGSLAFALKTTNSASDPTEMMRLTPTGLGIGTTSPSSPLTIESSAGNQVKITYPSIASYFLNATSGGDFAINKDGTERARIDSSGRLLVGTSDGSGGVSKLIVQGASNGSAVGVAQISYDGLASAGLGAGTDIGYLRFTDQGSNSGVFAQITATADATTGAGDYPGRLVFSTTADGASSPTERMRIDNAGRLFLNTTSITPSQNALVGSVTTGTLIVSHENGNTGSNFATFYYNSTIIGAIAQASASSVSYNTSSDYRLKENISAVTDGISRLQQLKPSRFNFIADPDKTVDGFLAHEVQDVVPEAITGEKDAVDDDGNPIYQGIDQSKLVPLLTAALQEAIGEIESLKARLTAAGI